MVLTTRIPVVILELIHAQTRLLEGTYLLDYKTDRALASSR